MDLKEYIKSLVRQQLEEESTTSGVPGYMTPYAFSKGKGKNAATKTAEKQGMKVTKGETTMPSDSKVRDYVSLTGKKKKKVKIYETEKSELKVGDKVKYENQEWEVEKFLDNGTVRLKHSKGLPSTTVLPSKAIKIDESDYDKASPSSNPSLYSQASGYTGASLSSKGDGYYKKESMQESLQNIIKEELLNEVTYNKFKNEVKFRTKNEQLHKAIREVKRKLSEIDRIVEYTSRMKQELSEGEEGVRYWKATQKNVATISEMVNQLNNKIKNLQQ